MLSLLAASVTSTLPAWAGPDARQVIETMVTDALKLLRDEQLKKKTTERRTKLREVADKAFDWEAMARGSLGHHWRKLEPAQRTEFVNIFKDLIARQYMDDVDRFRGNEDVKILSVTARGELFQVKTQLVTASNEKVPMDYTLHRVGESWKIEDMAIEGVSMVKHYRESFNRFLVNKSFPELLEILKRKLG
jgi:phospholipid transport system substrate-binding protein